MQLRHRWCRASVILACTVTAAAVPQIDPSQQPPPPSGQARELPAASEPASAFPVASRPARPRVVLDIVSAADAWGLITLELDSDRAPTTVDNFLRYVDSGFYAGTIFHRVIPGFLIQGGGYEQNRERKTENLLPPIQNEAAKGEKNRRYTIAMARASDPDSATSQFLINLADNPNLDHPGRDGWGYCVFGRVVGGQDVVDRIAQVATQSNPLLLSEKSLPQDPPRIRRAYRSTVGGQETRSAAATTGGQPHGIEELSPPPATPGPATPAAATRPETLPVEPGPNTDGP